MFTFCVSHLYARSCLSRCSTHLTIGRSDGPLHWTFVRTSYTDTFVVMGHLSDILCTISLPPWHLFIHQPHPPSLGYQLCWCYTFLAPWHACPISLPTWQPFSIQSSPCKMTPEHVSDIKIIPRRRKLKVKTLSNRLFVLIESKHLLTPDQSWCQSVVTPPLFYTHLIVIFRSANTPPSGYYRAQMAILSECKNIQITSNENEFTSH